MAIDSVRYVGAPSEYVANAISQSPEWRNFGERIGVVSRALCPVGKIQSGADAGKASQSTHLRDTMEVKFITGDTPMILVGSALTREHNVSALGLIIEGTDPHPIDPVNAQALRFISQGQTVFAKHVNHPGTKKNDFVTRSMRAVCLEAGGI